MVCDFLAKVQAIWHHSDYDMLIYCAIITVEFLWKNKYSCFSLFFAELLMSNRWWRSLITWQAIIAILGSLYYSFYGDPVANIMAWTLFPAWADVWFPPCDLCWYARILLYPFAWMGAYAYATRDDLLARLVFLISIAGIALETYHYTIQKILPWLSPFCSPSSPCDEIVVEYFGFITIPLLCLVAFIVTAIASYRIIQNTDNT